MPKPPHAPVPRMKFEYDNVEPKPAFEPPRPTSEAAQNATPNPYKNSLLTHEKILEIRAKSTIPSTADATIDWNQDPSLYPADYPHFVRGRDSVRKHLTSLFNSKIAMYDGAMGTMIQNYGKKH
ncbi:hypothetical protein TrVE_jg13726, partial [Triparma verrucosa]